MTNFFGFLKSEEQRKGNIGNDIMEIEGSEHIKCG